MFAPELAGKTISNLSTGDATDAVKLEGFPKEIYADQMIGLITGALVRKKAGMPSQSLADRIPASLKVMHTYHDLFSKSVPGAQYDNPGASVDSCVAALDDALNTFRSYGVAAELPQLFSDPSHRLPKKVPATMNSPLSFKCRPEYPMTRLNVSPRPCLLCSPNIPAGGFRPNQQRAR